MSDPTSPIEDYDRLMDAHLFGTFRDQLDHFETALEKAEATKEQADEAKKAAIESEGLEATVELEDDSPQAGRRPVPEILPSIAVLLEAIESARTELGATRLDSEKRQAKALGEYREWEEEDKSKDHADLEEARRKLAVRERADSELRRQAIEKIEGRFFDTVRRKANAFWDELEDAGWNIIDMPTDQEMPKQVEQFEDALIRLGWPLTFDTDSEWDTAAKRFVPGLDRLVECIRTAARRRGLRVLQRSLKDTEVGLYDGEASADDLALMNQRRKVAGYALTWLLRQPCPPCRPTDALRREIDLVARTFATSPIGDPRDRYVDDYEEQELISTVVSHHQAPPDSNPGMTDPRFVPQDPTRSGGSDTQTPHDVLSALQLMFGSPPMDFGTQTPQGPQDLWNALGLLNPWQQR